MVMITDVPHFSVIVPTYNRPDSLTQCLYSLAGQDYAQDRLEVIVVVDGSRTPVESISVPFQNRIEIHLIRSSRKGAASARNTGAEQARGEFLAFTDDDCSPHSSWLGKLAECCGRHPGCAVTGKTLNLLKNNAYASAAQLLIDYLYAHYNSSPQHARFLTSNNFAVPASAFRELGGFSPAFASAGGEDREFCDRWLSRNFTLVYEPQAVVYHCHSMTLTGFIKQQFNYGRGAFRFNRLRYLRNGSRFSVEPLAFYVRMFKYPYLRQNPMKAHLYALLFAASQGINFAGFAFENLCQAFQS